MSEDLRGKVVWITGAARGIGKAIAEEFACRGASLALTDVMETELNAVAHELNSAHGANWT
jgi:NAD(P)-dependent dehydrogenase (short-subunit alcohol dehydrogenase family)